MQVEGHHDFKTLQALTRQQEGRRAWKRYRAIVLAKQNKTAEEIAAVLDCGACTVRTWVKNYNAGGVQALAERPRTRDDVLPVVGSGGGSGVRSEPYLARV